MILRNLADTNSNPGRYFGATSNALNQHNYSSKPSSWRNRFAAESGGHDKKTAYAVGYLPPYSWSLPQQAGGLSSHKNAQVTVSPSGAVAGGLPGSGSATITVTTTATGGLIVSGSGSASITLSPAGTLISVAAGSGSATITLSGSALIGALAGLSGSSNITMSPTAVITAIGYLSGLSTNETEFSADALARAVWDAIASDFNLPGTIGEKLNAAGTSGDPWTAALPGTYVDGTAGKIVGDKLLTWQKFLALK